MYDFSFPRDLRVVAAETSSFAFFMDILLFPSICEQTSEHQKCNRVANWISLKTELKTENRVTQFEDNAEFRGVERGTLPEAVFLYLESFDFHIQRRPRNSKFGSGTIWPSNFSIAFRKSRFDAFLLIVLEGLRERT